MANAIERRLERMRSLWNGFAADGEARLLIWRCDLDERRMVDMLVALEAEEGAATPDVFLQLEAPVSDAGRYAGELLDELQAHYAASVDGLRDMGIDTSWQVQPADPAKADGRRLLEALDSFRRHYAVRMDLLVIYLAPTAVADAAGWRGWLGKLGTAELPERVRFMTTDLLEAPLLDGLDAARPARIKVMEPDLDMGAAIEELARSEGAPGPAKEFRCRLVTVANAAASRNPKAAERASREGLKIARGEGWIDQEVVIHMAMGAARLAAAELDKAATSYRDAIQAARRARQAEHPAGAKLELAAGMGLGGALVAAGRWQEAARVYEAVTPIAEAARDGVMTLESLRMAAWCHEQAGADADAWRCGTKALDAGAELPAEQRAASTLPWVGRTMLGLLGRHYGGEQDHETSLRARLDGLMGTGWEKRLELGSAAA